MFVQARRYCVNHALVHAAREIACMTGKTLVGVVDLRWCGASAEWEPCITFWTTPRTHTSIPDTLTLVTPYMLSTTHTPLLYLITTHLGLNNDVHKSGGQTS